MYVTGFISIDNVEVLDICWLGIFDVSQEEVTWWCGTSVGTVLSNGEADRTTTAVDDFEDWSQAGILSRLVGNEIFNWSSKRILAVRLYRRV